jgi:pilus assembly protein FimV
MSFNKTKSLDAAQKYLNQGKLPQAIAEYQEILRHEPRDQVTLMTVGDLYVRQGETFKALEYFERLAQLFAKDGFLTKSIAIYKKIAKLAPEETRPLERLAELYVQQGVMSEARPLYLHLAETHMRANRNAQAVALLRKLLEAEPDNLRVHHRLAELYLALGQKKEAAATFLDCAERQFDRGDLREAEKLAERALEIDPALGSAASVKARSLAAGGHHADAAALLETLPGFDSGGELTELLIEEHLHAGNTSRAAAVARAVFSKDHKKFAASARVAVALKDSPQPELALDLLDEIREAMTEAGEQDALAKLLQDVAQRTPGRFEAREWLVELYARVNDSFRIQDALQQLGEAAASAGDFARAQRAYEQLHERVPQDENVARRLDEIRVALGIAPLREAAASPTETPAEPAPRRFVEPPLDEETQRYVSQSLTDADLFSSYGLSQKAITLLEAVFRRAPRHTPSLEKLLDLYLGAGNDRRTAELAARLELLYGERGDLNNAERFSQLRRRFQRAAGLSDEELVAAASAAPSELEASALEIPAAIPEAPPVAAEQSTPPASAVVHEVDLSDEWAALSEQVQSALASPAPVPLPSRPGPEPLPVVELEPAGVAASDDLLSNLSIEFEERTAAEASPAEPLAPPFGATPENNSSAAELSGPLSEVFNEFRTELGEIGSEDEDLETHYNLGTAYREMGLLDEAIGEFQKVAQASEKGRPFRYAMQCCTLLGIAFMEKGQPEIASIWYERALRTSGLDQESILALRYDLGVAQEKAGDAEAALKTFSQVYAINIDYRDVAERIAALGKRR